MTDPLRVLFVCTANICRSPAMELMARQLAGDALRVSSAGTHALEGHPMSDEMAATVVGLGLDPATHRSRPLTRALVDEGDLVVTAEAAHRQFVLDERPEAFRKVFTIGQLAAAVEAEESGLAGADLLAHLARHRGAADPALDVIDPYRRGPEANSACSDRLADLLRAVVPALTGSRMISPWKT